MSRIVNVANSKNMTVCFVCDQKVSGEKVNLAAGIASHSKVTLPEKISQLIGDDYVVAVTEQDCLCKRCASLINHMDKLESELTLVKHALKTYISTKYKINVDGHLPDQQQGLANGGLKTDSASDHEDEIRKNTPDCHLSSAKKKAPPLTKILTTPKPAKPAENVTKLKIYKCGFCSYQSKELGNVRLHMKIHIRANKSESEGDKPTIQPSPLQTPKTPVSVRRRVFRCQVCSASFDDRNKCLEHISKDHTAAGRKMVEQKQNQEQQKPQMGHAIDALANSTSRVNDVQSTTENQETQKQTKSENIDSQEEMDTSEPPSIALYNCDSCPSTFNNDVEFATHVNEHAKIEDETNAEQKAESIEADSEKSQETDFTEIPSQSDSQDTNDEDAPKDSNISLDIEAMIAALHNEGPESGSDSMPNI